MPADPMPVFTIKAKDNFAPTIVAEYVRQLDIQEMYEQAKQAQAALEEINAWRERNPDACKWPDHEHVPAGLPGSGSEVEPEKRVTTPHDDPIVQACVDHGGHFWPDDAPEDEPPTCTRCWYNPGWVAGKSVDEHAAEPEMHGPGSFVPFDQAEPWRKVVARQRSEQVLIAAGVIQLEETVGATPSRLRAEPR